MFGRRRRDFVTLLGAAAASSILWPFAARAQRVVGRRCPLSAIFPSAMD
jgi:hypothetical protein